MKSKIFVGIVVGLIFFVLAFVFVARPWYLRWGATDAEIAMSLPGDQFMHNPIALSTRAITIDAPAVVVWQWLVQTGQGRGGFYSQHLAGRAFMLGLGASGLIALLMYFALGLGMDLTLTPSSGEALAFWLGLPMLIYIVAGGVGGWILNVTLEASELKGQVTV